MLARTLLRAGAAAAVLGGGALLASCNLVLGAGDYQVAADAGAGETCGLPFAVASCASCVETTCCAEARSCAGDAACGPLYQCLTACGLTDAACRNDCTGKHPVSVDNGLAAALEACLSRGAACGAACSTCGGLAEWYGDACGACAASVCCDKARACADDEACAERQRCYRACTYPSCPIDCDAHVAASVGGPLDSAVITGFDTCVSKGCGKQCEHGAHWGCVGGFTWPAPSTSANVTFTVRATAFTTGLPFADATIRACARADLACDAPLGTALTGPDGLAALSVPAGFNGYFDATAADTLESLVYVAWPLTSDTTYDLSLGPYDLYKMLVTSGGGVVNDNLGALFVYTRDCLGADAPGVELEIQPRDVADGFYFVNGSPVSQQTSTSTDAIGGFSNVDAATITLTAKLAGATQTIATTTALVRIKTLTYVTLTPTP
jgi:hypothetical protein